MGTGTAAFPPAPKLHTYSSPWSPGWETHHSLVWPQRQGAECRASPAVGSLRRGQVHSLQRTQTMDINPILALLPAPSPPPSSQLVMGGTGIPGFNTWHRLPHPRAGTGCSAGPSLKYRRSGAHELIPTFSTNVRKPLGKALQWKLKGVHKRGDTSEYGLGAVPKASWAPSPAPAGTTIQIFSGGVKRFMFPNSSNHEK